MHLPFQAVIHQKALSKSTLAQFARFMKNCLPTNGGQLLLCSTRGNHSKRSIDTFAEGQTFTLTIRWDASSFSAAQQEKKLNVAVENLKDILKTDVIENSRLISNKNMEPIVSQALDTQNFSVVEDKLEWCLDAQKYPSFDFLKALAQLSVESKNSKCVTTIRTVIKAGYPERYIQNARLLLYSAEAFWRSGNVPEALGCLQRLFREFPAVRPVGMFIFSRMVAEAIQNQGHGAISQLIQYAQKLVDNEQDYYPITIVWSYLYSSEWFADQQEADELLDQYGNLRNNISSIVEFMALKLLKADKIQDVFRILELTLKLQLFDRYSSIQRHLFTYQYNRGNILACTEIYKTSVALNIPLAEYQKNDYLRLTSHLDDEAYQKLVLRKPVIKLKF